MITYNMEQGSTEWLAIRLGLPTASEFSKIITPAKGELSKSARSYAQQLVAETLMGEPIEPSIGNLEWVARGKLLEPVAVQQFEFTLDVETRPVGFITTDCGRIGCSPDRLIVGQNGCLEVKCPSPAVHIAYLTDGPGLDHKCQIQGILAVGEFEFCDFYSYHPQLPPALVRVARDEPYISKMRAALGAFLDLRDAMLEQARASGFFEAVKVAA
jgi:hypothetical protein